MPVALSPTDQNIYDAIYIDGYRNLTSTLAKVTLFDEMIQFTLYDPNAESKIQNLQFSYSSIEVLNIAQEREIACSPKFPSRPRVCCLA